MWCSTLVNFSFLSWCAAARTPDNPRDLGTNGFPSEVRRCVRSSSDCPKFSPISPLPSADSAGSGTLPLFAGFSGTMELSDSPATCLSDLWRRAFSDRSAPMGEADVAGVSRLPWEKFPTVPVVFDSVRVLSDLPLTFDMTLAFPLTGQGRPPHKDVFGARYTARLYLCERFALPVTRQRASLEAEATG